MTRADRVAQAALGSVGARFRLHGRDPATGLDCIGLAAHALQAGGFNGEVPDGYALRGGDLARIMAALDREALIRVVDNRPGDLLLFASGPAQFHVAIAVKGGIVHADAMLRRVVVRPGAPPWPLLARWRLPDSLE